MDIYFYITALIGAPVFGCTDKADSPLVFSFGFPQGSIQPSRGGGGGHIHTYYTFKYITIRIIFFALSVPNVLMEHF